jgi:hypothetical protein
MDDAETKTAARIARLLALEPREWEVVSAPVGNGQVAECRRWEFTRDDERVSVVAKSPSRDETSRSTARLQHLYRRETAFYQQLRSDIATRTPVPRHVEYHEDDDDFLLLLEDLSPVSPVDQFTGLTLAQATTALDELAGLHAPTASRTELFARDWLAGVTTSLRPIYDAVLPGLFDQFLERYGDRIDEETRRTVVTLRERLGAFGDFTPAISCVVHSDYRSENLLFDGLDGRVPLAVVDWQTVTVASPLLDVAYLLTTSLTSEQRAAHENDLLEHYLGRLADAGVTLKATVARGEFARYTLQPIVMLVAASVIVERTERGDAMFLTMIRRAVDAVAQWDAFGEIG